MKQRLDVLLTQRGIAPSREKAKAYIMSGDVYVEDVKEDKPGSLFPEDARIEYRGKRLRYVSRGGLKLEKAVEVFSLDLTGRVCLDIGASTGGFTDCMLQNGAAKVYAIDVGYGQLAYALRTDARVVCMERTNFRYVTPETIGEPVGFSAADVSFISLDKILPAAYPILEEGAMMVALIKPQFEAGREKVGKKGVVRDRAVHEEVIRKAEDAARRCGFSVLNLDFSPVKGPEGNIEYLLQLSKGASEPADLPQPQTVVSAAHAALDR